MDGTIWISNRPGESDQSPGGSGDVWGQAIAAAGAGLAGAFGADNREEGDSRTYTDVHGNRLGTKDPVMAEQKRRREKSIAAQRARDICNFHNAAKTIDLNNIPPHIERGNHANESLSGRVARLAGEHMALLRPKFPDAPGFNIEDFCWRSDDGDYLFMPELAGLKIDLGNNGKYKFISPTAESASADRQQLLRDLYRRVSEIYIIPREAAAYSAIAESEKIGCSAGLSQYNIQSRGASYYGTQDWSDVVASRCRGEPLICEFSIHNMMKQAYLRIKSDDLPSFSEEDDLPVLIRNLSDTIEKNQIRRLDTVLTHFTDGISKLETQHQEVRTLGSFPALQYSPGNFSRLDGGCGQTSFLAGYGADGHTAGLSIDFAEGLNFIDMGGATSRLTCLTEDNCVHQASDWLQSSMCQHREKSISISDIDHKFHVETKKSWNTWDEVGRQLSTRIMQPIEDGDNSMLRRTAQYYAICWAKAKQEAPPTQCIQVFREHAWTATANAVQTLVIGVLTKTTPRNNVLATKLRAVWDSFGDTIRDSRCVQSNLDRQVDQCVKNLYESANCIASESRND